MKTEFPIPLPVKARPREARTEFIHGDIPYAPLSLPHLLAQRIEVGPRPRYDIGRYRWKRDDEAVN
jgi:hypothetical protein